MAVDEPDALKLYWDHFFKAETGTYEKSTWLDLFLAEFLIRLNEGINPKELIKFCPVSGVVTLVGCELLCGVHRVTSSINTHYSAALACLRPACPDETPLQNDAVEPKAEDTSLKSTSLFTRTNAQSSTEILRKYLLGGVAWKCLVLLRALGVEGLSCCRQLSSVLIWVFGEVGAVSTRCTPATPTAPTPPRTCRPPIHQLFSNRIWAKQKPSGQGTNSAASSEKESVSSRSMYNGTAKSESEGKSKRKPGRNSDVSTESGDSNEDLQILNRSLTIKVCTPNDDFEYFNSPVRSPNDFPNEALYSDPFYSPRKAKPKADFYMNNKHKEIINSEISTFEFTLIITDLLKELCKAESSLSGSEGSQISMQCINFALKNLCSLQFGSLPAQSVTYESIELSRIKLALTELLIVSLDQVLVHSDLCAKLINNGILPMLLRILEDVICKSSAKFNTNLEAHIRAKDLDSCDRTEADNLLKFIFGIAYSITAFFHCLLMQCRTVDKLREFTDQFKLYGECLKGGLLKECIELMIRIPGVDEEESVMLIKKLIESIGKLISGMKRVRSEIIHTAACPKSRHKVCRQRVAAGMHHHHDILGEAGTGLPLPSACCVSVLYGILTSLVPDEEVSAHKILRNKILRVMLKCGVCCCFSPSFLMESIVRLMLTHNSVATLCLQLLEHTVYGDLGASVLIPRVTDQLPCSICEQSDDNKDLGRKYCSHGVSPIERKSVWSFLIHYNSLLQLDNHNNVLHATVSHLLKVTPKCRMEMKYELLFSVVYPTFIVSKHRYIIRLEESAYFLTVSCLNIFSSLLNTVSFAEQFIQKGGLSYVLELVSLPEFSNQCCAILEIAIIVEIFKLMKENAEMTYYREMSTLASVQMLFKSLTEMTDKCYKIYKMKLPTEKFEELCDVSAERMMLALPTTERVLARKASAPVVIKTHFATGENVLEETIEDHIDILKNIWTFWKSCAGLCLYSPMFREYIISENVFVDSYALLKLLLHYLCNCESGPAETRVLIKIMEALLTVQFAVSEATSGRSKDTSCAVVRAALGGRTAADGGSGLRALCDALIGVAVARPSRCHAMPTLTPTKVPPLFCASGTSSADCSSSEESATGPYASEHSEPRLHADDGYEADVEVGKLDASATFKARNLSDSLSFFGSVSGRASGREREESMECTQYNKSGELAHPELCVIVIDILTQLIDKLLTEEHEVTENNNVPENGHERVERVCASLARACCARLAGGGAPRHLLRRLLAPAAPAARLLATTDKRLADLQRSILELVQAVGGQGLEAGELAAVLRLFLAERPPLHALLPALRRLLHLAPPHAPDASLAFPVLLDNESAEEIGPCATSEANTHRMHLAHLKAGIQSSWGVSAGRACVEGTGWAPWLQGFALSVWLRPHHPPAEERAGWQDEPADEEEGEGEGVNGDREGRRGRDTGARADLMHVLSLGHESLMFELWMQVATGVLTVRLTRPEGVGTGERVVSSARAENALSPHRWTCLALNVAELVHRRRIHIQVTLFLNGRECETLSLPLQGILVRKTTSTCFLVGEARTSCTGGSYHMSNVRVYRSPIFSTPAAVHLAAHGPDHPCQVRCELPNIQSIITPELLDLDIDWDQVYEIPSGTLREVHDNLAAWLPAHAPDRLIAYHQSTPLPAVFGGRGGASWAGGEGPGGAGAGVEGVRVRWAGAPRTHTARALPPALLMLGGPDILLYLFARVVELEGTAEEQACALGILLRACRVDARLHAMLHADGDAALNMLLPVFAAPQCRVSYHILKVILDETCSKPILSMSANGTVLISATSDSLLLEPRLLVLIMRAWRHFDTGQEVRWEVTGEDSTDEDENIGTGCAWSLALTAIRALVHSRHPRRAFNHYQAARVDLLRHLLLACKERFLNSDCGVLSASGSGSLVRLVRALIGAPPLLAHLALLTDFLLLMHQASDTFVTHSRANFYFLLTPDTPEASEFNFLSKRKQPDKWLSEPDRSNSATSDDISNHVTESADSERTDAESSTESTKHLKGIINMRIKESRKHHISSTSENSDIIMESSEKASGSESATKVSDGSTSGAEDGGQGEDTLDGYVVVDNDDVAHTTVHLYTSGIYQQRKVRAGAEPGWRACEGLLLLLRDTIAALPEHLLAQAVPGAVSAEVLVVLANHRSAAVRAALVRALAALQRARPVALQPPLAPLAYTHLAHQVSLYGVSWELVSACASLITKCDLPLEDQLDEEVWEGVGPEAAAYCGPLLALLPAALPIVPLAHNMAALLRRLIHKSSVKSLVDVGLPEVVVRSIRTLGGSEQWEGHALLMEDLCELLDRLALKVLAGNHSMQTIVDIHHMLTFTEVSAGDSERVVQAARAAQVSLYICQLDYIEERLATYTQQNKHTNYFTNVLSSAVENSLSRSGRRSGRGERAELAARHSGTVGRALAFLLARSPRAPLPHEPRLLARLLDTLLAGTNGTSTERGKWWAGVGTGGAEWGALQEVFWWAASPAAGVRALQPLLLRALYTAPPVALRQLTPKDPSGLRKMAVYLLRMLQGIHAAAESGQATVELAITDWARDWAVASQTELADRLPSDALPAEADRLLRADEERWAKAAAAPRVRAAIGKAVFSKEALACRVTESAMMATRLVVETQNGERKAFLEHLRTRHAHAAALAAHWQRLLDTHTHERAVWHSARGYPAAWQLDSTEGPGRVRLRLRRAHLRLPPRCLLPAHRHKLDRAAEPAPLRSVLGLGTGARGGLAARLQLSETVAYMARVARVTVAADTPGELLLTDRCIHFVPEENPSEGGGADVDGEGAEALCWSLGAVSSVATRRWCLQERAVELFLRSGHAHLIAFEDANERAVFLRHLARSHLPNRTEPESLAEAMNQWRNGTITNWEYLMRLNGLAGRSYNDLMQYPVFPFILADYTSRILDLTDPNTFRDLSKPMAVQNKNREQHYINTYNDLKAARREGCSPLLSRQPHHYASLYSNSGGVLHYLVRMPPFTQLFLNYQDNNFDMPDRTFHSLSTTWRLITNDSPTDVKELIPEMFYLPEMFYNNEGLDLGVRQCGARVDGVELPRWAPDARLFTLLHRHALESPRVTETLPHWIDLVFGYKQTGQHAIDAINVFPACTYYGFDPLALEDEVDRTAAAAMVRTYGQAPRQLLRAPHPQRAPDLAAPPAQVPVWGGVVGARWGAWCGSPERAAPRPAARRALAGAARLHALPAPRALAVTLKQSALLTVHVEDGVSSNNGRNGNESECYGVVTWDGDALRLRRRRDLPPDTLLHVPALDEITCVASYCGGGAWCPVVVGFASGRVTAVTVCIRAGAARASLRTLHAHAAPLADVCLCPRAGLLATASTDGLVVLWDLHELTYIRTLPNRDMLPVTHVAVSETLSDVGTVHDLTSPGAPPPDQPPPPADHVDDYEKDSNKYKSLIRVHTVNGSFVGSVKVAEQVTCVCYSAAMEGASVNCIAAGLDSGGLRFYSAWDLRPVAFLPPRASPRTPVLSVTYSSDSQLLLTCYGDGVAVAWESLEAGAKPAPVRILPAHALL